LGIYFWNVQDGTGGILLFVLADCFLCILILNIFYQKKGNMVLRAVKQYVQYAKQPRGKQNIETRSKSLGPQMRHWRIRRDQTIDFIKRLNLIWPEHFLDIGEDNLMGLAIGLRFSSNPVFLSGDLDNPSKSNFHITTCLDVLEHLLNPLLLLNRVRSDYMIVTYPHSNSMFWGPRHWHEFYESEFLYLLKRSNYKPLHMEKKKVNLVKTRYFWLIREA